MPVPYKLLFIVKITFLHVKNSPVKPGRRSFSEVGSPSKSLVEEESDSESDDVHVVKISKEETSPLKIFPEANKSLDEVITFLETNGHTTEATNAFELTTSIVSLSYTEHLDTLNKPPLLISIKLYYCTFMYDVV